MKKIIVILAILSSCNNDPNISCECKIEKFELQGVEWVNVETITRMGECGDIYSHVSYQETRRTVITCK